MSKQNKHIQNRIISQPIFVAKNGILPLLSGVFIALSGLANAETNYAEQATQKVTGATPYTLPAQRALDSTILVTPALCAPCAPSIVRTFSSDVISQNGKVNPATDELIKSLTLLDEVFDMAIKDVKNLKLANALYSFPYQTEMPPPAISTSTGASTCTDGEGGCKALDFSNPEDQQWYRENIIDKFESGSAGYSASSGVSSAYGRYQFMASTGADYCQVAPASLDCCGGSWTYSYVDRNGVRQTGTTTGRNWRVGANAVACQDAMFAEFTRRNINEFTRNGIPANSCTIYLAHQQGVGGLTWIMGGNLPSGTSFATMKDRVRKNVGARHWENSIADGLDPNNEADLRKIYQNFWNKKFCGDITENVGDTVPLGELTEQAENFATLKTYRDTFFRRGILFELIRQKEEIRNLIQQLGTYSAD